MTKEFIASGELQGLVHQSHTDAQDAINLSLRQHLILSRGYMKTWRLGAIGILLVGSERIAGNLVFSAPEMLHAIKD